MVGIATLLAGSLQAQGTVVVGSKKFNESYILAEIIAQLLESDGMSVERRFGLGGTLVCFEALRNGEIDVYPEYSGTLEQAILKSTERLRYVELAVRLDTLHGVQLFDSFGFNNTYAIALKRTRAQKLGLAKISDLTRVPDLRYAFSHEFLSRTDGWPGLAAVYGLDAVPRGIEHGLAYRAIDEGKIDVTDVYSTDGDIDKHDLLLLDDDRRYFPVYMAAPLGGASLKPRARALLARLADSIGEEEMRRLNGAVLKGGLTFAEAASEFLHEKQLVAVSVTVVAPGLWSRTLWRTATHLKLTLIALVAGMLIAIPLGVFVYRVRRLGRTVVYLAGVLQTVPSIALLALMIPVFGIGMLPAVVALFLYALLPILRNTATALMSIDPVLRRVAIGMGLTPGQRLRWVELPLAAPTILAGVKTAAVINIGTATLAAFIGAGGLGEPIVTGLALNDTRLILEGAVPAAILAILTELGFELIERVVAPAHLRSAPSE